MNNKNTIGLGAALVIASLAGVAQADELLLIDLSVENQMTVTATDGLSAADAAGSSFTGFLLADFFNNTSTGLTITNGVGDLTVAGTTSDGSPSIFHAAGSAGLNIWSFTGDSPSFTAGQVAFTGSATWTIDAASYADLVDGNSVGDIYSPADSDDDIPTATYIGTYRVVPAPASVALLGLGSLAATRRRR
ncbi:MAG: PEP-CTERM sorting domain-containing protein [Phycisphaerales bacterium JB052]